MDDQKSLGNSKTKNAIDINIKQFIISMTGCDFDTTMHLFQHARVVGMDATAPRNVPTIRTVRGVTPYVIVPKTNSVILCWAV